MMCDDDLKHVLRRALQNVLIIGGMALPVWQKTHLVWIARHWRTHHR